jgi:propanediol dehydratase small subunit
MDLDITIVFNQAAFTHNVTEKDIRFAFDTARFDGSIDEDESDNKHLVIGFNRNANLIEVMYNVIDENTINVFHAMPCRKSFLSFIKIRGEDNG